MADKKELSNSPFGNPFFRDREKEFDGGDQEVHSPVMSVFSEGYVRGDGSNTMNDVLREQAPDHAKGVVTAKKGKK